MPDEAVSTPLGRYSSIRTIPLGNSNLAFLSGIAAIGVAPFDVKAQTEIIFGEMARLLAREGGGLEHLVKITAFLADIRGEYAQYNEVRNRIFANVGVPPASSAVGITMNLSAELRIEIEGVAVIPQHRPPAA